MLFWQKRLKRVYLDGCLFSSKQTSEDTDLTIYTNLQQWGWQISCFRATITTLSIWITVMNTSSKLKHLSFMRAHRYCELSTSPTLSWIDSSATQQLIITSKSHKINKPGEQHISHKEARVCLIFWQNFISQWEKQGNGWGTHTAQDTTFRQV